MSRACPAHANTPADRAHGARFGALELAGAAPDSLDLSRWIAACLLTDAWICRTGSRPGAPGVQQPGREAEASRYGEAELGEAEGAS